MHTYTFRQLGLIFQKHQLKCPKGKDNDRASVESQVKNDGLNAPNQVEHIL